MELGKFDFDPVAIFELVSVAKPDVGSDLNYVPRVTPGAFFVLIRAQQECRPVKDPARNDTDGDTSSVLMRFESNDILRKRIGNGQFDVESARIQQHTRFLLIQTAQPCNPDSEIGQTADDPASKAQHLSRNSKERTAQLALGSYPGKNDSWPETVFCDEASPLPSGNANMSHCLLCSMSESAANVKLFFVQPFAKNCSSRYTTGGRSGG